MKQNQIKFKLYNIQTFQNSISNLTKYKIETFLKNTQMSKDVFRWRSKSIATMCFDVRAMLLQPRLLLEDPKVWPNCLCHHWPAPRVVDANRRIWHPNRDQWALFRSCNVQSPRFWSSHHRNTSQTCYRLAQTWCHESLLCAQKTLSPCSYSFANIWQYHCCVFIIFKN